MAWQSTPYTVPLVVATAVLLAFAVHVFRGRLSDGDVSRRSFVALGASAVVALAYATQLSAPPLVDAGGYRPLEYAPTPALLGFAPTPALLGLAGTAALVGWVVFRHPPLDVSSVTRDVVFENLSDGVVVCDDAGRIVDRNGPARALFPDAEPGSRASTAFADLPDVAAAAADGSGAEQLTAVVEDGSVTRFLSVDVHLVTGSRAACDGTVLVFRDVTERETLRRRYRALVEKSPNVVAVCGDDGLVRYVSPSVERLLDRDPAVIEGRPVIDLIHPEDRRAAQRAFERAFESDDPQPVSHRAAHADGSWRRFETVIESRSPDADEVVVTATDVTESRRYEQRLQVLNRVLRHDLKNDVNVIGGYADLLRDHVDDGGDEYLDVIDRKVETLTHLSDQAREIDVALHSDAQRTRIDAADLVERLCESLSSSFPSATVTASTPESAVVVADDLLESAVRNVLENAVVHNDGTDPTVDATVTADGDRYRIDVADNGPGIPPIERTVFSEARETPLEHASGLGLWLVHWIITESGGDLDIDTREPTGTVVRMWLPRVDGDREDGDWGDE